MTAFSQESKLKLTSIESFQWYLTLPYLYLNKNKWFVQVFMNNMNL